MTQSLDNPPLARSADELYQQISAPQSQSLPNPISWFCYTALQLAVCVFLQHGWCQAFLILQHGWRQAFHQPPAAAGGGAAVVGWGELVARSLRALQLQPPRPLRQADPSREGLSSAGRLFRGESDRCAPLWRNAGAAPPATVNAALC